MKPLALKSREKFLILELSKDHAQGLFMSVDDDRNLVFEKFLENITLKKFLKSPARSVSQKSWEGQYLFKSHRKVIAIADSSVATTIPIPLNLERDAEIAKEPVALPELENLIAQAMAKIFNQCRAEAGHRLLIDELDTILVNAKTSHMKLDNKSVRQLVGSVGKKISLLLELTFTGREIFEDLKQFFNSPDAFFFAESAQAQLLAISQVRPLPLNLISTDDYTKDDAFLFVLQKTKGGDYPILYREKFRWNFDLLIQEISASLGVTQAIAQEIYKMYRAGGTSESFAHHLRKIIERSTEKLLAETTRVKIKGPAYVSDAYPLPFDLPYRHGGVIFEKIPTQEIMEKFGFTQDSSQWLMPEHIADRYLAAFFEAYFDKSHSEINQKLRRRLHWLTH